MTVQVKRGWWERSSPEEIQDRPWLHPAVVETLEVLLKPEFHVLEHGSGGSTLWMAERVEWVVSVEGDGKFYEAMKKRIPAKVTLHLDERRFPGDLIGPYDLMLVDGEPVERRCDFLKEAWRLVKPGGWVILDNANRPEFELERFMLQCDYAEYWIEFNCNQPGTKYLVTDFYKLKGL